MENKVYHLAPFQDESEPGTKKRGSFISSIKNNFQLYSKGDKILMIIVFALLLVSLLAVFSSTMSQDPLGMLKKQGISILLGFCLVLFIRIIPNGWFTNIFLINSLNFLTMVLIFYATFFGQEGGGASSWINLAGFNFQPSELFKVAMVITCSRLIIHFRRTYLIALEKSSFWYVILPFVLMVISGALIFKQPDIGTTALIIFCAYSLFMMFYFDKKKNIISLMGFILFAVALYLFSKYFADDLIDSGRHIFERLGSFINPFNYQHGIGYQVIQSYKAIANGGLLGVGLGQGVVKEMLPAAHTDFILSVIAEETGLLGASVVIILLLGLGFYLLQLASRMTKLFHRICITGFAILLFVQTFVNIGGLTSLIPLTGVTLPFVSYGGTSMMVNLLMIGIIQKFVSEEARMQEKRSFETSKMKGGLQ
ncbi:FtsW/RodA/SpoVE family cell cycle protein [Facklamia miroungae]|uniref:Probable peptidoglycan glycosyltransferase FtsW n=1 Tax=Facklamia miroungae TaxID=120956 RepID=A0A1G7U4X0_9LACT|nr:FtsW/RodA/SpoVE family cell cycle protein [Facklamia miroungae]NKZ29913.1 FtsW/RodA/SpoVE family cell cycle protein [Facklamia miroungae]SDG42487.1 cell division protein FtsW [Facklamia miroungae]